jgi:hypothetical protein
MQWQITVPEKFLDSTLEDNKVITQSNLAIEASLQNLIITKYNQP